MELQEAILRRRSIRKYTDQEVTKEQIDALLKAAYWAPRVNERWRYVVVRDEKTKHALGAQPHVPAAPVNIVVCIDWTDVSERDKKLYAMQEASAGIQNILLTVHELGLGACWNCSFDDDATKQALNLPDEVEPIAIISLGHPAEKKDKGLRRKTIEEIVRWEKF